MSKMAKSSSKKPRISWPFWTLCAFIIFVFATGGSSRADILSVIILRPIAVLVCAYGAWGIKRGQIAPYQFLFGFAAALFAFVGLQLIPLPPAIWSALPGREIVSEIDRVAGLGNVWRPISMVPVSTWNALFSMSVPLAVLLLGVQLTQDQRFHLLWVFLALSLVTGVLGLLQATGGDDSPLYLYKITNNGWAVGLFANRNHQAMFLACIFPMLAITASAGIRTVEQARLRQWAAGAIGAIAIPLVLVTGSRGGLIASVVALIAAAFLFQSPKIDQPAKRKIPRLHIRWLIITFATVGMGLLTALFSKALAIDRLLASGQSGEDRFAMWPTIAQSAWHYFPIGSGTGSFVEINQIDEPLRLLTLEYTNHAHNDFLELYLTSGLMGLALLGIAIIAWFRASVAVWKSPKLQTRSHSFARLGSVIILIMAISSIGDYPVRLPSIMCLVVVSALWLQGADKSPRRLPQ